MNLLAPDLLAEVTICIGRDGRARVFTTIEADATPETQAKVASAIVRGGVWWGEQRGLHLEQAGRYVA